MARRPRLVHEGSPIIDADSGIHPSVATTTTATSRSLHHDAQPNMKAQHAVSSNLASFASAAASTGTTRKPYKLQTRLVVGEASNDDDGDLDMMAMDEDKHDHQHESNNNGVREDHPTSQYYGSHGHVYFGHHTQNQQHSMGHVPFAQQQNAEHMAFGTVPVQHQQQVPQPPNEFYNHGPSVVPANPIHYAPINPTPTIYQMPPPSTSPLVVLDAANIAYNYSETLHPIQQNQRRQPDPKGIRLAIEYFLKQHCRVQAVVPISWYQLKPRPGDHYHLNNRTRGDSDAKMVTEEVEELRNLRQQGFLVACPPGDDDDAYAMALARREEDRLLLVAQQQQQQDESMGMDDDNTSQQQLPTSVLGGYVVSNDMFHDAIRRDDRKQKEQHSHRPLSMRPISLKSWLKKNRISYSFANVGTTSEVDGEIRLDFLPNPRNDLIDAIDTCNRCGVR